MANLDIKDIGDAVRKIAEEQGVSISELSRKTGSDYNTIKSFLKGKSIPKLDILQNILRAVGYEFTEILEADRNPIYLDDEDNNDFRLYRRLEPEFQDAIKMNIKAYLSFQEQEGKKKKPKKN